MRVRLAHSPLFCKIIYGNEEKMLGIIVAMQAEAAELLRLLKIEKTETISSIKYHCGSLNSTNCVIAVGGVGKVNAAVCAQTMALEFSVKSILNFGLAGATCKNVKPGDIIVAKSAVQHDVDTTKLGDPVGMVSTINLVNIPCNEDIFAKILERINRQYTAHSGVIASADKFVHLKPELDTIHQKFNAIAVEMEAGSIAQTCYLNKIDCICIKIISDSVFGNEETVVKDYLQSKSKLSKKLCKIIYEVVPEIKT